MQDICEPRKAHLGGASGAAIMSSLHRLLPRAPMTSLLTTAARWLSLCLSLLLVLAVAPATAQTVFFHNDVAGSPIAATDQAGNLMWRETYRPYGGRMIKAVAANTQWFHGKPLDPDTGLEDFGARKYDPDLGWFLSNDPVDFQDKNIHSFNRNAYGNNNPLKYKDPDGRLPVVLIALAVMKVADNAMTAYDIYQSYQSEGVAGAATTLGTSVAMSAMPGLKVGKAVVHEAATVAKSVEGVAAKEVGAASKVFSKEKQALVDMAKADKKAGMTAADMQAYKDLNKKLPDPFPSNQVRGPEAHTSGAPSSQSPHGHVGPVDHIPIRDPKP